MEIKTSTYAFTWGAIDIHVIPKKLQISVLKIMKMNKFQDFVIFM